MINNNGIDVEEWEDKIQEMVDSGEYEWYQDFLMDVLASIKYTGVITERQIISIETIENKTQ